MRRVKTGLRGDLDAILPAGRRQTRGFNAISTPRKMMRIHNGAAGQLARLGEGDLTKWKYWWMITQLGKKTQ